MSTLKKDWDGFVEFNITVFQYIKGYYERNNDKLYTMDIRGKTRRNQLIFLAKM